MQYVRRLLTGGALAGLLALTVAYGPEPRRVLSIPSGKIPKAERQAGRAEYYFTLLRDPATDRIPDDIRARELAYAATLPVNDGFSKHGVPLFDWSDAGPIDVGGRTRAFAVDVANLNVLIAGSVSGGIWKSSDAGASWRLVSSPLDALNVTSLAQDPRPGRTRTWYAVMGEYVGQSQRDRGGVATIYGQGLYKSTDNGDTWAQVRDAGGVIRFDTALDFTMRVTVSPTTGSLFVCSNVFGISRAPENSTDLALTLGGVNDHRYCDVQVDRNGRLLASVGDGFSVVNGQPNPQDFPTGLYVSNDDGLTWRQIGTGVIPASFERGVVAIAPSNPNVAYAFLNVANQARVYRLDLAAGTAVDRTASLPTFNTSTGNLSQQLNYNQTIAVKPDDENFVVIGATSLFRTRDGFATKITSTADWIGGYSKNGTFASYPNHHADVHLNVFDARVPNRMWSTHDGGLSVTANVADQFNVTWTDLNNRYNVTQMYTVVQPEQAGDNRIAGGTQDNGTPLFAAASTATLDDISSGDGSYAAFIALDRRIFTSTQYGSVRRYRFDEQNNITEFAFVSPAGAFRSDGSRKDQLFVHPFVVDPVSEVRMIYPEGDSLWRNSNLPAIPNCESTCPRTTTIGWEKLDAALPVGYRVSTLELTTVPVGRLYYAGYSAAGIPRLYRLDNVFAAPTDDGNAATNGGAVELSLPGAPTGAYIHDIAVNASNGNEVMVVMSNYNIRGLYYSGDGGASWTVVEGNLEGNATTPGPSLRSAQILTFRRQVVYLVGTSTGLFASTALNGDATVWERQNPEGIGLHVVEYVSARPSDGRVLAGTHGRGVFQGLPGAALPVAADPTGLLVALAQPAPNPASGPVTFRFALGAPARVTLGVFDATGRRVAVVATDAPLGAGRHSLPFDASTLAPGLYAYRLSATEGRTPTVRTGRLVVVR
jgi:hypothetical protein